MTTDQDPAPLFYSTAATPELPKPHLLRVVDLYVNGDKAGAHCQVCGVDGGLGALKNLGPSAYGCTKVPAFQSPAPQWM